MVSLIKPRHVVRRMERMSVIMVPSLLCYGSSSSLLFITADIGKSAVATVAAFWSQREVLLKDCAFSVLGIRKVLP